MVRRILPAALPLLAAAGTLALSSPPATAALTVASHPRIGARAPSGSASNAGWASSNWSGYAQTGGTGAFTAITGQWTVTPVARTRSQTFSSTWVGIDGFNDSSLIQTGTEADYYNGSAHYYAWWEILPAAETVIPSLPVQPGDVMSAGIHRNSNGTWNITLSDSRTGSFTTTQNYGGALTSAEWIQEAPSVGGRIANLAHFGNVTIDPGTLNGAPAGLTASQGGVMIQHGVQVSTPSAPDGDKDGFAVAYGSSAPPVPAS
ncbi:MAG TPA: G1 family glutamic endopeptidase [Candidatus Dormibacteraeota bacterium]